MSKQFAVWADLIHTAVCHVTASSCWVMLTANTVNAGLQKSEQKKRPEHVHLCDTLTLFIPAADDSDSRGPGSGRPLLGPVQLMFWRLQEHPSERPKAPWSHIYQNKCIYHMSQHAD